MGNVDEVPVRITLVNPRNPHAIRGVRRQRRTARLTVVGIGLEPERFSDSRAQGSPRVLCAHPRLTGWVWVIVAAQVAVLLATSTRYGYHRDELYFIVAGGHPAFGYPDQPPLVPLLSWAMHAIAPSLLLLRTPSTLAAAMTTLLAAQIARELRGDRRAQIIAAASTACSAFALAVAHLVSTTTFEAGPDGLEFLVTGPHHPGDGEPVDDPWVA